MISSLLIIFGMLSVYGWLASVAAGVSLLRLLPATTLTRHGLRLFTPRWEAGQALIIAATASLLYLFAHNLAPVPKHQLLQLAGVTSGLLVLRAGLLIWFWYRKLATGLKSLNFLYSLVSFAALLAPGMIGSYALTGRAFWQTAAGWLLLAAVALLSLAIAFLFVYYSVGRTPHDRLHQLSRWLNVAAGATSGGALLVLLQQNGQRLASVSFTISIILSLGIIALQALLWFSARERYMWWYLSGYLFVVPSLLLLANRPYLVYPSLLLRDAYRIPTASSAALLYGALAVVVFAAGRLLWPLVRVPKR